MTHHHHAGHAHPPARLAPSLLRLSAFERLAIALGAAALIWIGVLWSLGVP